MPSSILSMFNNDLPYLQVNILTQRNASLTSSAMRRTEAGQPDECMICFLDILEGESITQCEKGCPHFLHLHCLAIWSMNKPHQIGCPTCSQIVASKVWGSRIRQNSPGHSTSGYDTWSSCELETGGTSQDIPLPDQVDPLPDRSWTIASHWTSTLGRGMVTCLFARDWSLRDTALRRLAREVANVLKSAYNNSPNNATPSNPECSIDKKYWRCTAEILTRTMTDKVIKVYVSSMKCLQTLLVLTRVTDDAHVQMIKSCLKPVLQVVLSRCQDGNKRIADISMEAVLELCKGNEGRLGLGIYAQGDQTGQPPVLDISYILHTILEDPNANTWQSVMGRLAALESMMLTLGHLFILPKNVLPQESTQYFHTMVVVDFCFRHLTSIHSNVRQYARNIFIQAARMTLADWNTYEQVLELLNTLEPTLQLRMKKRLKVAVIDHQAGYMMTDKLDCLKTSQSHSRKSRGMARLNRSFSHSPSRSGQSMYERSSSQSPHRYFQNNIVVPNRESVNNLSSFFNGTLPVTPITTPKYDQQQDMEIQDSEAMVSLASALHKSLQFETPLPFIEGLSFEDHSQFEVSLEEDNGDDEESKQLAMHHQQQQFRESNVSKFRI